MRRARLDVSRPSKGASKVNDEKSSLTLLLCKLPDCPEALRPWPGGWPLPAAGGRRHHCGRRPTKPVFCSRFRRQRKSNLIRKFDFLRPRAEVLRFHLAFGGDRRRTHPVLPPRINGLRPGFAGNCLGRK